ncbi:hypothetical protein HY493_00330 [Candidatus Woesearchaeota archaeon]|nr:hypothetical protein [Candidatus Woesearchaeota archaeon]
MGRLYNQAFSLKEGIVHFLDAPLSQPLIDETRRVLASHRVPVINTRSCYESLWFCIASQYSVYERPLDFTRSLHGVPLERLADVAFLQEQALQAGLIYQDRFGPAAEFIAKHPGGIMRLARELLEKPGETRDMLTKEVNFINMKTASFWHLCLGGTKLMTLDRHNYRQLAGLGLDIALEYYVAQPRKKDRRKVLNYPDAKEYARIEEDAKRLLGGEQTLQNCTGLDCALATGIFWVVGALFARGTNLWQKDIFCEVPPLKFSSPYSGRPD